MDQESGVVIGALAVYGVIILAVIVGTTAGMWKVFEKAGQPGWVRLPRKNGQ